MSSQTIKTFLLLLSIVSFASADVGKWLVSQDNNITCLIVEMDIKVNFTYITNDNSTKNVLYQIPANKTTIDTTLSKCGEADNTLGVLWDTSNSFVMKFSKNNTVYGLESFVVNLNASNIYNETALANQTVILSYENQSFDVPSNFSFHCNKERHLNATNGVLITSKVQFEAFRHDNKNVFSNAKDCESSYTDIVPIAVGVALVALIVVVLFAYIVGRKRQQARGYLNIM